MRFEDPESITVEFVGIREFRNAAHNDLCGKSGLLADLGVKELVEIVLPEGTTSQAISLIRLQARLEHSSVCTSASSWNRSGKS